MFELGDFFDLVGLREEAVVTFDKKLWSILSQLEWIAGEKRTRTPE